MDGTSYSVTEVKVVDSILFIRVKVNDLSEVVKYILDVFSNVSWLDTIDEEYLRASIEACTKSTISDLTEQLKYNNTALN